MVKFDNLYISYLRLVRVFAKVKPLSVTLIEIDPNLKPQQTEPIYKLLEQIYNNSQTYTALLQTSPSADSGRESEHLRQEVSKTYAAVKRAVDKLRRRETQTLSAEPELSPGKRYVQYFAGQSFATIDMRDPNTNQYKHHYIKSDTASTTQARISRLAQELSDLSNALPVEPTNAIFVRADKDKVYLIKALIMGSAGTPYAHGAFEFDLYCGPNYPKDPPKMNLMTTGGQAVRFNPNLYACGKVCLSLLGTWRGNSTENWDPRISTILQVLMSTQAIVMSEDVYFNEPGFEGEAGTPDGEKRNRGYANIVKYCNIKYAMIEQIRNPPRGFETVVRAHFYLKRDEIMKTVKEWINEASSQEALYTGLVSDHNYNW